MHTHACVLREICRGCRLRAFFFNGPAELLRMEISDRTMEPLPLMMQLGVHTQSTLKKDHFFF